MIISYMLIHYVITNAQRREKMDLPVRQRRPAGSQVNSPSNVGPALESVQLVNISPNIYGMLWYDIVPIDSMYDTPYPVKYSYISCISITQIVADSWFQTPYGSHGAGI